LEYTKVTVLVDDKSTESGQLFYRRGKTPELRIEMQKPESKIIVFKKNRGEIFLPRSTRFRNTICNRRAICCSNSSCWASARIQTS